MQEEDRPMPGRFHQAPLLRKLINNGKWACHGGNKDFFSESCGISRYFFSAHVLAKITSTGILHQAEDQIRIGTICQIFLPLAKFAHTRIVAPHALHIEYDLKMQMRRPVAVLERNSKLRKHIARFHHVTALHILNGVQAQMTIQSIKMEGLHLVTQNNGCTIITVCIIKAKAVHNAVHRRHHLRVWLAPDVDSKMQTPGLFPVFCVEYVTPAVDSTVFIVPSDPIFGAGRV